MKNLIVGSVLALAIAGSASAGIDYEFEGAEVKTAAELEFTTKYTTWEQVRMTPSTDRWLWNHCTDYVQAMSIGAFTGPSNCLGTIYKWNGNINLDRIPNGTVLWVPSIDKTDPAVVLAAFENADRLAREAVQLEAAQAVGIAREGNVVTILGNPVLSAEQILSLVQSALPDSIEGVSEEALSSLRSTLEARMVTLEGNISTEADIQVLVAATMAEQPFVTNDMLETAVEGIEGQLATLKSQVEANASAVAANTSAIAGNTSGLAALEQLVNVLPTSVGLSEVRINEIVDTKIAGIVLPEAGLSAEQVAVIAAEAANEAASFQGFTWKAWFAAGLAVMMAVGALGYLLRRSRWARLWALEAAVGKNDGDKSTGLYQRFEAIGGVIDGLQGRLNRVEGTQKFMLSMDARGHLKCPELTQTKLDELGDGDAVRFQPPVFDGNRRPSVELVKRFNPDGKPYLEVLGIAETDKIDPAKIDGDWKLTVEQVYRAIGKALLEDRVVGLGKLLAVAA